jgi:hypothetical protein
MINTVKYPYRKGLDEKTLAVLAATATAQIYPDINILMPFQNKFFFFRKVVNSE